MEHGTDEWGWLTALGAEYPEGLCDAIAAGYAERKSDPTKVDTVKITEEGTIDPLAQATKQQVRKRENADAIGGMRSPHRAVARLPGWGAVGTSLRSALDDILDHWWPTCQAVVDSLGTEQDGFPEAMVEEARRSLEQLFGTQQRSSVPGKVRADLVEQITKAARDPDDVIASWLRGHTPLGIKNAIQTRGVFPLSSDRLGTAPQ